MVEAARMVEEAHPDVLDINFGCPVKKVAGKGRRRRPAPRRAANARDHARRGQGREDCQSRSKTPSGAGTAHSKIIVRPRRAASGLRHIRPSPCTAARARRCTPARPTGRMIARVKENPRLRIPVIGNGDITTPERLTEAFEPLRGRRSNGGPRSHRQPLDFPRHEANPAPRLCA